MLHQRAHRGSHMLSGFVSSHVLCLDTGALSRGSVSPEAPWRADGAGRERLEMLLALPGLREEDGRRARPEGEGQVFLDRKQPVDVYNLGFPPPKL